MEADQTGIADRQIDSIQRQKPQKGGHQKSDDRREQNRRFDELEDIPNEILCGTEVNVP